MDTHTERFKKPMVNFMPYLKYGFQCHIHTSKKAQTSKKDMYSCMHTHIHSSQTLIIPNHHVPKTFHVTVGGLPAIRIFLQVGNGLYCLNKEQLLF